MRVAVIVFPGSNCERDTAVWFSRAEAQVQMVWHEETELPRADLVVLPGGFSYGDYLRAGALAAHSPIIPAVIKRAKAGAAVLGICNGFQILTETDLLPGTLRGNDSTLFACKQVRLKPEGDNALFLSAYNGEPVEMPIAHHAGNYYADEKLLTRLEGEGQIAFRYCDVKGEVNDEANPNGSAGNIAGIFNKRGNILGLMPHPERAGERALGAIGGCGLLQSLIAHFANGSS